ncbi:hypothetical protein GLOTRDRAFT_138709 [Gloeophyllum trabeum ATCC 11539]|uniref:Uncharacterized protein n=1 Tax=Gloeophyllum trabeum (strain ATCC 11539 / FP-39264 / Madison 617) TaxID=670483 RepID=S7Q7Q5_GLOTA|nr:uncharacterized protein GLOTRDRAFT_138709 [Gloeophyllum trabeum ATCC 11539]EPQ56031.1 hypothetical protein GLOTRDRAFT_138709 [Gloeophyllum trabeum ATCC 11539]
MSGLGYGHALWEPNPGKEYHRVETGNVGFIRDGFFHRLSNDLLPGDHSSHRWGVPEYYEPLQLPFPDYKWDRHPLRGHLHSTSVKVISANVNASGRQDAHFGRWFREYCLKHYASWLTFANDTLGFDLVVSDHILVTGRDLTTQWAMVAFGTPELQGTLRHGVSVPEMITAEFEIHSGWQTNMTGGVQHQYGPQASILLEPERAAESSEPRPDSTKCVFLRGYRIKERSFLTPKTIKAASYPPDLEREDRHHDSTSALELGDEAGVARHIYKYKDALKDVNLLDPILDHIPKNSDARVAVAHDEDLWPYLHGLVILSPDTVDIEVDRNGGEILKSSWSSLNNNSCTAGRVLSKPACVVFRSPVTPPTFMESLDTLAVPPRPLTLRPSQASLRPPPRRAASESLNPPDELGRSKGASETKRQTTISRPLFNLGKYLKHKSLRRAPSHATLGEKSQVPNIGGYNTGDDRTRRIRRLSTIADIQERGEGLNLPEEYRLDLPPPYALGIPEQYRLS